jgi:hypothetical protein
MIATARDYLMDEVQKTPATSGRQGSFYLPRDTERTHDQIAGCRLPRHILT